MAEIKFDVVKEIVVLSESNKGWTKELNMISWNGREAKLDIRDWSPNKEKMGKGITLSKEETKRLRDALNELDL
ncbi:YdbC family protein [Brassicibacter mesophilus]|uniref:YdbC family protein n=1 Tax=Brassicibacter mesophilus TaxID=745119 RepID=UPI003D1A4D9C